MKKVLLVLAVAVLVAGCAKKPTQMIEETNTGTVESTGAMEKTMPTEETTVATGDVVVTGNMETTWTIATGN